MTGLERAIRRSRAVARFAQLLRDGDTPSIREAIDGSDLPEAEHRSLVKVLLACRLEHQRRRLGLWPSADAARKELPEFVDLVNAAYEGKVGRIGPYLLWATVDRPGNMSEVYLAARDGENRLTVLKVLERGLANNRELRARFKLEIIRNQQLGDQTPPAAVRVLDQGTSEDGRPYFVMEYLPGGPLSHRIDPGGCPDLRALARWVVEAAESLEVAHGRGVVHRDVKPDNILLGADGRVHMADFGLASDLYLNRRPAASSRAAPAGFWGRVVGRLRPSPAPGGSGLTKRGAEMWTLKYCSPEQLSDVRTAGPAADVYSLGATLYEGITGRDAFETRNASDRRDEIRRKSPVHPRRRRPDCPRGLAMICLKCMQPYPSWRYPSAKALAADLRRHLDGRWPSGWWRWWATKPWRFARRHAVGVTIATLAFTIALAGLTIAFTIRNWRRAEAANAIARDTVNRLADLANQPDILARSPRFSQKILEIVKTVYEDFAKQHAGDPKTADELAITFDRLGLIELGSHDATRLKNSVDWFARAAAEWERLGKRLNQARSLHNQASALRANLDEAKFKEVIKLYEDEESILRELPDDPAKRAALARCWGYRGDVHLWKHLAPSSQDRANSLSDAERFYQQSHEVRLEVHRNAGKDQRSTFELARSFDNLARVAAVREDWMKAVENAEMANELRRNAPTDGSAATDRPPYDDLADRAATLYNLGMHHRDAGDFAAARKALGESISVFEQLVREFPAIGGLHLDGARARAELAAISPSEDAAKLLDDAKRWLDEIDQSERGTPALDGVSTLIDVAEAESSGQIDKLRVACAKQEAILRERPFELQFQLDVRRAAARLRAVSETR